jgi:hypothetical protein
MGNVVVAIKPSSSGGASGVTRYIAESKRNPEKEGLQDKEPRPLFSANEDRLTYLEANELLAQTSGSLAEKEDLVHIVISLEKEDFEQLGETREEQIEAFKEIIREVAEEIENEVNFVELHWVAGIHLNTGHPHAHIAISREGWDRTTEKGKRIEHLPRTLLPHNTKDEQGEKTFVPGKIAQTVSNGIEKQRELLRARNQERYSKEQDENLTLIPNHDEAIHQTTDKEALTYELSPDIDHSQTNHEELAQGNNQINPAPVVSDTNNNIAPYSNDLHPIETPTEITEQDRSPDYSNELTQPSDAHEAAPLSLDQYQPDTYISLSNLSNEPQETQVRMHEPSSSVEELEKPPNVSEHLWRDRYILGRSMVARGEVDRLESDLKSTREHGDKRRFRVYDATHGRTRQISEFDIRRRADASATSAVRQAEIANPDKRHQARQSRYDSEIERHEKGIGDHQIIVAKTIAKLETQLTVARTQHAELKPHVHQIQQHYKANQTPLPVPLLRPSETTKLQDQAIAARNPARVHTIENIRESLATERGDHSRSDQEISRLDGQLLTVRSEQAARQERAHQFERTRHQTRWEIDGEKYSVTDLDRRISEQENRSRLFGTPLKISTLHLKPSSRRDAATQVKELKEIREVVVEKIEERRQELSAAAKEAGRMTSVLSEIHVKEQARLLARGGERQEKVLTRTEINQLIEHGTTLSDPAMLKQAFILEARFEERQIADDKKPSLTDRTARAIGREVLSEIALRQATERLDSFKEHKQFTPVAIKDLAGREQTGRLFDFRHPRHPLMWLAQRITESKEHRHLRSETTKAVETEHARLKEDVTKAAHCHELAKGLSDSHREHLLTTGQPIPDATFTPKQIVQLEIYATRHQDPTERYRVETLVNRAELAAHTPAKQTHKGPEPQTLPGDHLRHADQQRNDPLHTHQNPGAAKTDAFHLPEREHHSQAHLPQRDQQQASLTTQLNPTDLVKEAPDLDLLH